MLLAILDPQAAKNRHRASSRQAASFLAQSGSDDIDQQRLIGFDLLLVAFNPIRNFILLRHLIPCDWQEFNALPIRELDGQDEHFGMIGIWR